MRRYRFQLWPDKHGTGARQLKALLAAEDPEILPREAFARASVAVQGLPAVERLLFEKDVDAAAFGSGQGPSYRCELVVAIADNLARMADGILRAWTTERRPYRELASTADNGNEAFASSEELAGLFLRDLRTALQTVADLKLERPIGADAARAKPKRAESWRSERSLKNIQINLEVARELYVTGFASALTAGEQTAQLDRRIQAVFDEVIGMTESDSPLKGLVADPEQRPRIERLLASVRSLEKTVSAELPGALGLTIGFNALDGD